MIDLSTVPNVRYGERCKIACWTGDTDAAGKTLLLELRVSHDRGGKCFRASLTRSLASTDRGFTVREYQPFRDIVFLGATRVARYSDKALEATFDSVLATVPAFAGREDIAALLVRAD